MPPTRRTSSRSKPSANKIEGKTVNLIQEPWTLEQEGNVKKYFALYADLSLDDALFLTGNMVLGRSPISVALKLHELGLIDEDKLLGHFPDLEGRLSRKEKTIKKEKIVEPKVNVNIALEKFEAVPESLKALEWLKSKLQEALLFIEFEQMTIGNETILPSKESIPFQIIPLEDEEWTYMKMRAVQLFFKALRFASPDTCTEFWSVPSNTSKTDVSDAMKSLTTTSRKLTQLIAENNAKALKAREEEFMQQRRAQWTANLQAGSILSTDRSPVKIPKSSVADLRGDQKTCQPKRPVRSPLRPLTANAPTIREAQLRRTPPKASSLDDIFVSPVHKRTKKVFPVRPAQAFLAE
ncbi:hypothetical protein PROFUN_03980 [Planoprotostelium fungivorum]|uniref:Uncharacterized protein n=1 Tax=Planoprotostelium fungivorum TaxID=1890364 RepID=A0A2P6NW16_9EUKA|nr:hypothetical protein PROFUN_03980 [Planoprotostelium fungivorum]